MRPEEMFECVFTCGADCRGTSLYPCLQVFVNNSESNSVALLHFDEQQLVLNPKVSGPILAGSEPKGEAGAPRGARWNCAFMLAEPETLNAAFRDVTSRGRPLLAERRQQVLF